MNLSLEALRLDYVDLYLIEFPVGFLYGDGDDLFPQDEQGRAILDMKTDLIALWKVKYYASCTSPYYNYHPIVVALQECCINPILSCKTMETQVDEGRCKSIGLSNFNSNQIERIDKSAPIKPSNLQVELHAYFQQKPLRQLCAKHGITVCAYGPLGSKGRYQFSVVSGTP